MINIFRLSSFLFLNITVLLGLYCNPWESKKLEISQDDKGDITTDYDNGYKFSLEVLPKQGYTEEEINRTMGIPTRRWTYTENQVMKLKKNEFEYNKILLYVDAKRIEIKGDGYAGFENREFIDVAIFLLDGKLQDYTISHFVLDSEKQWQRGPLNSGDTTVMEPIMETFPDSTNVYKKYWEQFGTHPAHAKRNMPESREN